MSDEVPCLPVAVVSWLSVVPVEDDIPEVPAPVEEVISDDVPLLAIVVVFWLPVVPDVFIGFVSAALMVIIPVETNNKAFNKVFI